MTYDNIVIIGAGECGVRAAFALREKGYEGAVTLIGEEASLPYERPPLSKEIPVKPKPIRKLEAFEAAKIDLKRGVSVDLINRCEKHISLGDGSAVYYDKLLLATGAKARNFPTMEGCLTLRTDKDAEAILVKVKPDAKIGIIGGGFIGLELAATARKAGAVVTVVEAAPRILGRAVPEEIASILHARHEVESVNLMVSANVVKADETSITLANENVLNFDLVVAGVGSLPNIQLAEDAGIITENGIVVDENFRTSDSDVFAAGDCCNFIWKGQRTRLESWKAAQDQGVHAAAAMLGEGNAYNAVPWFWSDQYDMTLQVAGLFDMAAPIHKRLTDNDVTIVFQCDKDGVLAAAAGVGKGNSAAKDIRIFEKLIARSTTCAPAKLRLAETNLKELLRAV